MKWDQVPSFVEAFGGEFYLDRGMIENALRRQIPFDIIRLESSFKIDFFPLRSEEFHQESFSRRHLERIDAALDTREYVQSGEDTVLHKLDWYREGGGVSENQWRDIISVLKTYSPRLEMGYLNRWSNELGLSELLARAKRDAGIPSE